MVLVNQSVASRVKMRSIIFLCSLVGFPAAVSAMSLEQAVANALDTHPSIQERYARFQSVDRDQRAATADYLPQLSVRAQVGEEWTKYRTGNEIDQQLTQDEVGVRLSQLIFDGFGTSANIKRLGREAEAERLALISASEDLALDVAKAYLETRKAEEILTLTLKHVQDHEDILSFVTGRSERGLASESDVAQVAARLADARSSMLAAQNNLQDQRTQLRSLVGVEVEDLVDPVPDTDLLPKSLSAALGNAVNSHPELDAAKADIEAAEQEVRVNKAGYWPRLSIEADAVKGNDVGGYEGRDEDARVLLVMEYDLYAGGRDSARSASSQWRLHEAKAVSQSTRRQIEDEVDLAWRSNQVLGQQKEILKVSVDAATAAERGYLRQYELGRRSLLDVLNAKVEVFLARRSYLTADYDQMIASYRVLNATGRLNYALRVAYPEGFTLEEGE